MSRMGEYLIWLEDQIDDGVVDSDFLCDVCGVLYDIPYQPMVEDDMNRFGDGYNLHRRYLEEEGIDGLTCNSSGEYRNEEPVVLEVLVALCIRLEHDILGEPGNEHPERWFWQMIKNFGIDENSSDTDIETIIVNWMEGMYGYDGQGGPFVLKNYDGDVRDLGLWDQAQHYIFENYSVV